MLSRLLRETKGGKDRGKEKGKGGRGGKGRKEEEKGRRRREGKEGMKAGRQAGIEAEEAPA